MATFGWLMLSILALFGFTILVTFVIPFVVTEAKMMKEKIERSIKDKRIDLDKRSEARRNRDEIRRQRDFELEDRKLDARLQKVDKQIALQEKKLKIAKELKEETKQKRKELKATQVEEVKIEELVKEIETISELEEIESEVLVTEE